MHSAAMGGAGAQPEQTFLALVSAFGADDRLGAELWREIEACYSGEGRHYHSLAHLASLLEQLEPVRPELKNWDAVLFALYYHDAVYDVLRNNNEAASAVLADERLQQLGVPQAVRSQCHALILATKGHEASAINSDINYFTDADLSVLGQNWERYAAYAAGVRAEYAVYPDAVYKPGRRQVLQHFLAMERLFKTGYFYAAFEATARENLERELALLNDTHY